MQAALPGGWHSLGDQSQAVAGIEIGGRGQRVAIADGRGRILGQAAGIDAGAPASVALDTVRGLVDIACDHAKVSRDQLSRVGIAFGGPVDSDRGVTLLSHRAAGFDDFPLVNLLEEYIPAEIILENDARAAALGETIYGAARGCRDVVFVHLGSGVGGGIIVDGRLIHGASGTIGEIGHMVVSDGGPMCSCGKPGHLEAYAAAPSIIRRLEDRFQHGPRGRLPGWSEHETITVKSIFQHARDGDEVASEVIDETIRVLGVAVANLITVLNPAAVIIGGSVAEVGTPLMSPLGARVRQFSYPASTRRVRLSPAQLRGDSALMGAIALALTQAT